MAIHDLAYATKPASVTELRWRLQVMAELGAGRIQRRSLSHEDAVAADMAKMLG